MAATLTPHKTTGLTVPARAGPAFGLPPFLGQPRAKWGPWQIQQPRKFGGRFAELRFPDACRPVGCPLPLPLFPSPPLPLSPPLPVPFPGLMLLFPTSLRALAFEGIQISWRLILT